MKRDGATTTTRVTQGEEALRENLAEALGEGGSQQRERRVQPLDGRCVIYFPLLPRVAAERSNRRGVPRARATRPDEPILYPTTTVFHPRTTLLLSSPRPPGRPAKILRKSQAAMNHAAAGDALLHTRGK